jgi:hypothetical protein
MAFVVAAPVYYPREGGRGQPGLAIGKSADFHDREDFSVLCRIKVFAIMKFSLMCFD